MEEELKNVEGLKKELQAKITAYGNEREKIQNEIRDEWDKKGDALKEEVRMKVNEKRALNSEEKTLNQSKNELGKFDQNILLHIGSENLKKSRQKKLLKSNK